MSKVILINPFEVPEGKEDECLVFWEKAAEFMRRQPGFISTRLHKAVSPEARFHFINVAEWESAEHFQTVIESAAFKELTALAWKYFRTIPGYIKLSGPDITLRLTNMGWW